MGNNANTCKELNLELVNEMSTALIRAHRIIGCLYITATLKASQATRNLVVAQVAEASQIGYREAKGLLERAERIYELPDE